MLRFYCDSDFVFTAVFVVSRVSLLLWFFTVPRTSFLLRILANLGPRSCCGFCCDSGFVLVAAFTVSRTSFLLQSLSCLGLRPCCSFCRVSDFVLAAVFAMSWVSYLLQFLPCLGLRFTATPASSLPCLGLRSRCGFAVSWTSLLLWFLLCLDRASFLARSQLVPEWLYKLLLSPLMYSSVGLSRGFSTSSCLML